MLLFSGIIFAQEKEEKKKDLWDAKMGLGAYYFTGNTDKFDLVSDFKLTRKDTVIESNLFLKGVLGKVEGETNKQEFSGGLKFDYKPQSTFSPFVLLSFYTNEFKDIKIRLSGFVGAKYLYYNSETSEYSISAAVQYDIEKYYEAVTEDGNKYRLSIRPKFKQRIGGNIDFLAQFFYQPNLENFDDYFFVSDLSLSTKLLKNLALKMSYTFDYESMPVSDDIEKADQSFITSLVLSF